MGTCNCERAGTDDHERSKAADDQAEHCASLLLAGVIARVARPGRYSKLRQGLARLLDIRFGVGRNGRRAVVATRSADGRANQDDEEGYREAGQSISDALRSGARVVGHRLEAMARSGTMQAGALTSSTAVVKGGKS